MSCAAKSESGGSVLEILRPDRLPTQPRPRRPRDPRPLRAYRRCPRHPTPSTAVSNLSHSQEVVNDFRDYLCPCAGNAPSRSTPPASSRSATVIDWTQIQVSDPRFVSRVDADTGGRSRGLGVARSHRGRIRTPRRPPADQGASNGLRSPPVANGSSAWSCRSRRRPRGARHAAGGGRTDAEAARRAFATSISSSWSRTGLQLRRGRTIAHGMSRALRPQGQTVDHGGLR